jgi:bacteriochlorophyll 4-vinyl reductase
VLSFLRQEGEAYQLIVARAGEYAAEWTVTDMPNFRRSVIRAMPMPLRVRLVMRTARTMIRKTYGGSKGVVRWQKERGAIDIRGSLFCEVRDPVRRPLCEYYRSAIRRVMQLFDVNVDIETKQCRATGAGQCLMVVLIRPVGVTE